MCYTVNDYDVPAYYIYLLVVLLLYYYSLYYSVMRYSGARGAARAPRESVRVRIKCMHRKKRISVNI